jgi:hypothetical protein
MAPHLLPNSHLQFRETNPAQSSSALETVCSPRSTVRPRSFPNLRHLHLDGTSCPSSVTPEVTVQPDPKALAEGRDPVLEAGLQALQ